MAAKRYAVIREGYVIDVVMWDEETAPDWVYPKPYDVLILETTNNAGVGDWYEAEEQIFYRPLSVPTDLPHELMVAD